MTWTLLSCVVPPWAGIEKKGRVVKGAEVKKGLAGKKKKKRLGRRDGSLDLNLMAGGTGQAKWFGVEMLMKGTCVAHWGERCDTVEQKEH